MRKPIIAGNWKMNNTVAQTKALVADLIPLVKDAACDVVICTPYTDLAAAVEATAGTNIKVGAENVHWARRALSRARSARKCWWNSAWNTSSSGTAREGSTSARPTRPSTRA